MNKIKNCFRFFSLWLSDKLMYWEIDCLRFRDELMYWKIDFWNTVLKFVLNRTHHIYVSNIYKVLDNTNKYEMKHYVELWKKERGL